MPEIRHAGEQHSLRDLNHQPQLDINCVKNINYAETSTVPEIRLAGEQHSLRDLNHQVHLDINCVKTLTTPKYQPYRKSGTSVSNIP